MKTAATQPDPPAPPSPRSAVRAALATLRPAQWAKNAVVAVPVFFALWDHAQSRPDILTRLGAVALAVAAFCAAASAVYTLNDLCDAAQDRLHPEKRRRPIAAGELKPAPAVALLLALSATAAVLASFVNPGFAALLGAYAVLQLLYSLGLKRVGLLDVFLIAFGFVLRAVAGAAAAEVVVSPWLLLCTFLLALFLALCKRRHEKSHLARGGEDHRAALQQYDLRALDQFIGIAATSAIVCYAIYTLSSETVAKFGTRGLCFTVPFVVFGVFRYLDLLYRHAEGGKPEKVLLTDGPMILTVVGYALAAWTAFVLGKTP